MNIKSYVSTIIIMSLLGCGYTPSGGPAGETVTEVNPIVGGVELNAENLLARHTVLIHNRVSGGFCTGILIHKKIVLTAAHCIKNHPATLTLAFGALPLKGNYIMRSANKVVLHPDYDPELNPNRNRHDLALLTLTEEAPEGFTPVQLADESLPLEEGTAFTAVGYGRITGKAGAEGDYQGSGTLRKVELAIKEVTENRNEFLVDQKDGKGICHGDSGGPAIIESEGAPYAIGVASAISWIVPAHLSDEEKKRYPEENDLCQQRSIYVNIATYRDWILETVESMLQ